VEADSEFAADASQLGAEVRRSGCGYDGWSTSGRVYWQRGECINSLSLSIFGSHQYLLFFFFLLLVLKLNGDRLHAPYRKRPRGWASETLVVK